MTIAKDTTSRPVTTPPTARPVAHPGGDRRALRGEEEPEVGELGQHRAWGVGVGWRRLQNHRRDDRQRPPDAEDGRTSGRKARSLSERQAAPAPAGARCGRQLRGDVGTWLAAGGMVVARSNRRAASRRAVRPGDLLGSSIGRTMAAVERRHGHDRAGRRRRRPTVIGHGLWWVVEEVSGTARLAVAWRHGEEGTPQPQGRARDAQGTRPWDSPGFCSPSAPPPALRATPN